jgi:predicted phage terminase large subunit-like protein
MASFEAQGSEIFKEDWVVFDNNEPNVGDYYVAIDMAGFEQEGTRNKKSRLDNTAISIVKVNEFGWWVKEIVYGRWTFEETANKIFEVVEEYEPMAVGIEKGIARQAIVSPLTDLMKRYNRYFRIEELTHGNKKKTDRIVAALQGRFEHGAIKLNTGDWNLEFLDELFQFPNKQVHDDLIDSLAYIDQLSNITYHYDYEQQDFEPLDEIAGY